MLHASLPELAHKPQRNKGPGPGVNLQMPPRNIIEPPPDFPIPVQTVTIAPESADWRPAYVATLAATGMHTRAAAAANIDHSTAYRHRIGNPEFAAQCDEAMRIASECLEAEARHRAQEGVRRLKFFQGEAILDPETGRPYVEHEHSDTLMMFLLKGERPDKYKDRSEVDLGGKVNLEEAIYVNLPPVMMMPRLETEPKKTDE